MAVGGWAVAVGVRVGVGVPGCAVGVVVLGCCVGVLVGVAEAPALGLGEGGAGVFVTPC